jgi:F0F1-type ATP synthase assembly protein I
MTNKSPPNPLNIATDLLACILVGLFLGVFLDKFFDLKPLFTIICLIMGVLAAIKKYYKRLRHGT